jgi:hypothetical protein
MQNKKGGFDLPFAVDGYLMWLRYPKKLTVGKHQAYRFHYIFRMRHSACGPLQALTGLLTRLHHHDQAHY